MSDSQILSMADFRNAVSTFYSNETNSDPLLDTYALALDRIAEYDALFNLQWTRMGEATEIWRKFNPGNDLVLPDLGELLTWLLERIEKRDRAFVILKQSRDKLWQDTVLLHGELRKARGDEG